MVARSKQHMVKGYTPSKEEVPEATDATNNPPANLDQSQVSDKSLQLKPAAKALRARHEHTPSEAEKTASPSSVTVQSDKNESEHILPDSTDEFDALIREAQNSEHLVCTKIIFPYRQLLTLS